VTKTSGGFLVTVGYAVKEKGTLKLVVSKSSKRKSVAANTKGKIAVTLKRHGKYTATLTLTSKTGVQQIRWTVRV
jgi:hypothetical protein